MNKIKFLEIDWKSQTNLDDENIFLDIGLWKLISSLGNLVSRNRNIKPGV